MEFDTKKKNKGVNDSNSQTTIQILILLPSLPLSLDQLTVIWRSLTGKKNYINSVSNVKN